MGVENPCKREVDFVGANGTEMEAELAGGGWPVGEEATVEVVAPEDGVRRRSSIKPIRAVHSRERGRESVREGDRCGKTRRSEVVPVEEAVRLTDARRRRAGQPKIRLGGEAAYRVRVSRGRRERGEGKVREKRKIYRDLSSPFVLGSSK